LADLYFQAGREADADAAEKKATEMEEKGEGRRVKGNETQH
jgi:hypothetical protein